MGCVVPALVDVVVVRWEAGRDRRVFRFGGVLVGVGMMVTDGG